MMNHSSLIGRLTADTDLRYTSEGLAVGTFTLAVNRNILDKQGERQADFIRCQIWRKAAENFANFTRKGSLVGVEGRIQTGSYTDKNGNKVFTTEIVVSEFALLEKKSDNAPQSQPRQTNQRQSDPFASHGEPYDVSDDSLPF